MTNKNIKSLRVKIKLIFKKNTEMVYQCTKHSGQAIGSILASPLLAEWNVGKIRVEYPAGKDYWNAGEFTNMGQARVLLAQFTEKQLVEDFS